MKKILLTSALLLTASITFAAHHAANLTDDAGMTLYTFDKDSDGVSNCYDDCATNWPPYLLTAGLEKKEGWEVVERKDGAKQWAFNHQPLYTWIGDQKAGDTTGDGVKGVWHIAKKGHDKAVKKVSKVVKSYKNEY